jgi:hypothetical protein
MNMPTIQPLELFIKISQQRMYSHYLPKLSSCIEELSLEALWKKDNFNLNSIGSIVLHICEHVKRNSIRFSQLSHSGFGIGIDDYFPDLKLSPDELNHMVKEALDEFNTVMNKLIKSIPNEIDMHSLYHLVEHTGYHLGQIVDRTKMTTNKSFNFCRNGISERNLKAIIEEQ